MKYLFSFVAAAGFLVLPLKAFAHLDERDPGLYSIVQGESRRLPYTTGGAAVFFKSFLGAEVCHETFQYKGTSSGVMSSATLVLVVDPTKTKDIKSLTSYEFNRNLKPDNMMVVPLTVNAGKGLREYNPEKNIFGSNVKDKDKIDFTWTKISDNSYEIHLDYLWPGEFGIFFRQSVVMMFDCCRMFSFTVPESGNKSTDATACSVPADSLSARDSLDSRPPGIYAVTDAGSVPLKFERGPVDKSNPVKNTDPVLRYKGISSGINASDTFVLVINPKRFVYMADNPFFKTLTPSHTIFLPLTVNQEKGTREYDMQQHMSGKVGVDFEWRQISLNSFEITLSDLRNGEYAFSTRIGMSSYFDYPYGIFGFTINKN